MARFKTIAGYFDVVTERQIVQVLQTEHVRDETGVLKFEEDGVKPVLREIMVDTFVDVPVRRWIDEQRIPLTPEEEAERDAEEANYEIEKARAALEDFEKEKKSALDKLTLAMSEQILMSDEDGKDIKNKYREKKSLIESASNMDELKELQLK